MKVAVYEKDEWSDDQRHALGALLDDEGAKKRKATSQEMKDFMWEHGRLWASALAQGLGESLVAPVATSSGDVADADDDLIGDDEDLLEDLI